MQSYAGRDGGAVTAPPRFRPPPRRRPSPPRRPGKARRHRPRRAGTAAAARQPPHRPGAGDAPGRPAGDPRPGDHHRDRHLGHRRRGARGNRRGTGLAAGDPPAARAGARVRGRPRSRISMPPLGARSATRNPCRASIRFAARCSTRRPGAADPVDEPAVETATAEPPPTRSEPATAAGPTPQPGPGHHQQLRQHACQARQRARRSWRSLPTGLAVKVRVLRLLVRGRGRRQARLRVQEVP